MLTKTLTIGPLSIPIYTLLIALAVGLILFWLIRRQPPEQRIAAFDALLLALAGAILLARAEHVLLNWAYFSVNTAEILQFRAGGLDWHGALLGAWFGLVIGARWQKLDLQSLLAGIAPAIPLIALTAWSGCSVAACAYGAEVATLVGQPPLLVHDAQDVFGIEAPRYNVQLLGMIGSALLLIAAIIWGRKRGLGMARLMIAGVALLSFALCFLRGDYAVLLAGLRLDQWLDLLTVVMMILWEISVRWRRRM